MPRLPRHLYRVLALAVVWLTVAPAVTYIVSGWASFAELSASPTEQTSLPDPSPATTTVPQGANTSATASMPQGTATISAQSSNATATTTPSPGLPGVSPQVKNAAAVTAKPLGVQDNAPRAATSTATNSSADVPGATAPVARTGDSTTSTSSPAGLAGLVTPRNVDFTAVPLASWTYASPMSVGRVGHTATLLPNGKVLVAGGWDGTANSASAELYDPATGTWSPTGDMNAARYYHNATLLNDGRVLVAGGSGSNNQPTSSAEIYNPSTGEWSTTGSMNTARYHRYIQVLLPDGRVLAAGGVGGGNGDASAELYNPATGTWTSSGSMNTGRYDNAEAVVLPDGKVLVAGGYASAPVASAELYNPATGTWATTGSMSVARSIHTMTLLPSDGRVLATGGKSCGGDGCGHATAELYDPVSGLWSPTGSMATTRWAQSATLLASGDVLVAGGHGASSPVATTEVYEPSGGTWSSTASMNTARGGHQAVRLPDGRVLVVGGSAGSGVSSTADIFAPSSTSADWGVTVMPQSVSTTMTAVKPDPDLPGAEGTHVWYTGQFNVDVNADGTLDPVYFVLTVVRSSGAVVALDISSDDADFGETAGGSLTNGVTGTNDDERITASGTLVRLGSFYAFVVEFPTSPLAIWSQQAKLVASDAAPNDHFGWFALAVSGDTMVVGAYGDDNAGGVDAGSAHVFVRSGTTWSQQAKLTASDAAVGDGFGHSVGVRGDTIVVGAPFDDIGGVTDAGSAYVFVRSGTSWSQQAKLTASDAATNDHFGWSVAIDGDTIVAGASNDYGTQGGGEAAYVFVRPVGGWSDATQTAKLTASDAAANDYFGVSVAIDGDTIVVGAYMDDNSGINNAGAAYVFVRPGGGWGDATQTAKLIPSDPDPVEAGWFGWFVGVSGDTVVVGAGADDIAGTTNVGSAYVFVRPAGGWSDATQTAKLTASDGAGSDDFGMSVAVSGDTIVVGADADDNAAGMDSGSAYVFVRPTGGWSDGTETARRTGSDAAGYRLGTSVAVDGDTFAIASYYGESAYVFVATPGSTSASATASTWFTATISDTDLDGDGSADDTYYAAITDINSDGLYDRLDLSVGDNVFGEGNLSDGVVDYSAADNTNDERVSAAANVKMGVNTFYFTFEATPAGAVASGEGWGWGNNFSGQLGDGTTTNRTTPVQVSGLTGVTAIAVGDEYSLALKSDGTVWAWGDNFSGQLGDGTTSNRTTPVQVSGLSGVGAIAAGSVHSLVLKPDGTVWAWGDNFWGQLGDGTTSNRTTPVQVSGLSGVGAVAGGGAHSLALKSDGTVWTWGNNLEGQLGDGTTNNRNSPVQVSGLTGVIAVAGGALHSLAVKSDGTVWAWGRNDFGQLGDGTTSNRNSPVQVSGLSGVTAVAGGMAHSLALKSAGAVWAWGYNGYGELGDGTGVERHTPVQVSSLTGVSAIAAGSYHSLALKSDGTGRAWGWNGYGQLGDATATNRATPVQVSGLTGATAIAGGAFHSLALKATAPAADAMTSSAAWWTGSLTLDANTNGVTTDAVDRLYFALTDTDSDGVYDRLDLSLDDDTFAQGGSLTDSTVSTSNDDEYVLYSERPKDISLGAQLFTVNFPRYPGGAGVTYDMSIISKTWYRGTFTIDLDGDGVADDTVNFALVDTNSDGLYDKIDLSTDDATYGETGGGTLTDRHTGTNDDEGVASGIRIRLGDHYSLIVTFVTNPGGATDDATITSSTWYTGTFTVDTRARGSLFPGQMGSAALDQFGFSVSGAGDINKDGKADFIVGAPYAHPGGMAAAGSAYVYRGTDGGRLYQKDGALGDFFGWSVAGAGDVNGDGIADFIVGAPGVVVAGQQDAGRAYVYSGADGSLLYQVDSGAAYDTFGWSVAGAGDVNGDGRADFIVGAPGADAGGQQDAGRAYVYSGADGSLLYQVDGGAAFDYLGRSVSGAGDVNGDGNADFIVGAPGADAGGQQDAGRAYVYSGATGTLLYQVDGAAAFDFFGQSVAGVGDTNGDGKAEFIVGAPGADVGGLQDAGRTYVYSGANGSLLYQKDGGAAGDQLGWSVAGLGDVNGDGRADFMMGAPYADSNGSDAGSAYVYSGASGSLLYQRDGRGSGEQLGYSVSGAGDVNGDGQADLIVGAPYAAPQGRMDAGITAVFSGADGSGSHLVDFVLGDTDSDGLYDTVDISIDDGQVSITFGEGALSGQSPRQTGNDDDERLDRALDTGGGNNGGSADVRLGRDYVFTVAFDNNPANDNDDARITATTYYEGTFVFDADRNGVVEAGSSNTVHFALTDTNSDGLYDTLDLSLGDSTFAQGGPNAILQPGDDERRTTMGQFIQFKIGTAATIGDGTAFTVEASFDNNPGAPPPDSQDASIRLVSDGISPITYVALAPASAGWLVDADGDEAADDRVSFVLSDTNSDGVVDAIDISIGDTVFGEGNVGDGRVDFSATDNSNDERVSLSQVPAVVKLGVHPFVVEFDTDVLTDNDDVRSTSRWYAGSFSANVNGSAQTIRFVQVSPSSDGLYTVLELDTNASNSYDATEIHSAGVATVSIGGTSFTLSYRSNPTMAGSVTMSEVPVPPPPEDVSVDLPRQNPPASEILAEQAREAAKKADAQDAPESTQPMPTQAAEPPPERVTQDITFQPVVGDEVVITLSPDLPDPEHRIRQIALATGGFFTGSVAATRTYQLQYQIGGLSALESIISRLERFTGVTSASHHYLLGDLTRTPNDSRFQSSAQDGDEGWHIRAMRAPEAWDATTGDPSVRIAVIDADFDRDHEDLRDNVASVSAPRATKASGHGTHVSGTICAKGNNGVGIAGIIWDCSLSLYDFGGASPVKAQEAMVAAIQSGARIINMSLQWVDNNRCGTLGTPATVKKVQEINNILGGALEYAKREGRDVLYVFAAGNECRDVKYASPASLVQKYPENVVVVGSVGQSGGLSPFSNYGDQVTVVAPGEDILSTLPNNSYGLLSGTSMATPHVSGLAALILSRRPALSAAQVKQCIVGSAQPSSSTHKYRLINAAEALKCGESAASPRPQGVYGGG